MQEVRRSLEVEDNLLGRVRLQQPVVEPQKERKANCGVQGATARPKDRAVAWESLKRSSAESALSLQRRVPSKDMSIKDCWTSPEKPDVPSQAWRLKAIVNVTNLPSESFVSSPQQVMNFAASLPSITAWERMVRASSGT
ncbi:hypothetical protein NDU88_000998 [Pleurodeles waltl]|uniref:Uncharacterized protein n=1 Tax=Pleurodeles waltl TaxID=8319 RepID=A0AAV7RBP1_PLEWA|nr:hypothetical protein NDU88_000998 [Pleurodeles waltl]